jgi:hypothetical protein
MKYSMFVVVEKKEFMAGSLDIPQKILRNIKDFIDFLGKTSYIQLGYEDDEECYSFKFAKDYFQVFSYNELVLCGYKI